MRVLLRACLAFLVGCTITAKAHGQRPAEEEAKWEKYTLYYAVGYDENKESLGRSQGYEDKKKAILELEKMKKNNATLTDGSKYYASFGIEEEENERRVSTATGELRRPKGEDVRMSGAQSRIKEQRLGIVDPGESANSEKKRRPTVIGKAGKGNVDRSEATIRFEDDGTVVFGGKITGTAKLDESVDGVVFESKNAKYEGKMEGNRVFGTRKAKDLAGRFIPGGVTSWEFTLQDEALPMQKGQSYNPPKDARSSILTRPIEPPAAAKRLSGKFAATDRIYLEFDDSGKVKYYEYGEVNTGPAWANGINYTPSVNGNRVTIRLGLSGYHSSKSHELDLTWDGADELKGTHTPTVSTGGPPHEIVFKRK